MLTVISLLGMIEEMVSLLKMVVNIYPLLGVEVAMPSLLTMVLTVVSLLVMMVVVVSLLDVVATFVWLMTVLLVVTTCGRKGGTKCRKKCYTLLLLYLLLRCAPCKHTMDKSCSFSTIPNVPFKFLHLLVVFEYISYLPPAIIPDFGYIPLPGSQEFIL